MGDYGFEGAGEFGGMDTNFNCLPDYHFSKCPFLTKLKDFKFSEKKYCKAVLLSGIEEKVGEDAESTHQLCDFCGDNYKQCPRYVSLLGKNRLINIT